MAPKMAGKFWQVAAKKLVGGAKKQKKARQIKKTTRAGASYARLDKWSRGVIWGLHLGKVPRADIAALVDKIDGTKPKLHSIDMVIAKKKADPVWRGESGGGGRPETLTQVQKAHLVKLVFQERGKAVVTSTYCKSKLPFLRDVSKQTVATALHAAGLAWLTRRLKAAVPPGSKPPRMEYCH